MGNPDIYEYLKCLEINSMIFKKTGVYMFKTSNNFDKIIELNKKSMDPLYRITGDPNKEIEKLSKEISEYTNIINDYMTQLSTLNDQFFDSNK